MLYDPKWEKLEVKADTSLDNEIVQILRKARDLITDKSRWTTGEYARDKSGRGLCSPLSEAAVRFCSVGALSRVTGLDVRSVEHPNYQPANYLDRAAKESGPCLAYNLNDRNDHAAVMKMFDRAIELAAVA